MINNFLNLEGVRITVSRGCKSPEYLLAVFNSTKRETDVKTYHQFCLDDNCNAGDGRKLRFSLQNKVRLMRPISIIIRSKVPYM